MNGYDTSKGFEIGPMDDRDDEEPEYTVDPALSCTNTDFGGKDPATEGPDPMPEMAPAWFYEGVEIEQDDDEGEAEA